MQEIMSGAKIDYEKMTLEDLKKLRDKIRNEVSEINPNDKETLVDLRQALRNLNHQILMQKLSYHKHRSSN